MIHPKRSKFYSRMFCTSVAQLSLFLFFFHSVLSAREATLTILFTNDHHGQVEPILDPGFSKPIGGVTRRMALIEKIRQEVGPTKVLLVDGGDLFTGTALSGMTRGEADCAAYQLMQYDAIALGNHDFDYGKLVILEYRKKFRVPFVSANVVVRSNSQNFMRPYVLRYAGARIGLIGFSNPDTPGLTRRENVSGLVFNPPGASAKGLHSILKKDADIFVALSHLGVDADKKFAKDNPFLDVIIGGHSHTVLMEPIVEKKKDGTPSGAIICQAGSRGLYLGRLDLVVEGRRDPKTKKEDHWVKSYKYELIPITSDLPEDQRMVELLGGYKKKMGTKPLEEVLATVSGDLTRSDQGDSALGAIATDAVRQAAGAEIAFLNSGSFRSEFRSGPLTREVLYAIYPFDDEIIVMDISGASLRKAIEASDPKRGQSGFLQVSGLRIEKSADGSRILFGNEPLNDRRKYLVAMNDFLAQGGDGYGVFRGAKSRRKTQIMIRDLLEETLKSKQKISSGDLEKRWYSR